jgi:hypothetical protein
MTLPLPRWAPVAMLLVTNLLPLWLVLDGTVDTSCCTRSTSSYPMARGTTR